MPHISVKMISGRDQKAKDSLSVKISELIQSELNCKEGAVSIDIQEYEASEWKAVYDAEIEPRMESLYKRPSYHFEGDKLIKA